MKLIYALAIVVSFSLTGTAQAECDKEIRDMTARQIIERILTEASKTADIEQAPSDGNTVAKFKFPDAK